MNLLFWIIEIANLLLIFIPIIAKVFKMTRRFLVSKYGIYTVCILATIISLSIKFQCEDCYKAMIIAIIPIALILSNLLIGSLAKASEFNL